MKYIILLLLTACSSINYGTYETEQAIMTRDLNVLSIIENDIKKSDEKDRLRYELNYATAAFNISDYKKSIAMFERIKKKHSYFGKTLGEMTNDLVLNGESNKFQLKPVDLLYVCMIESYAFLGLKKFDEALAEMKSCYSVAEKAEKMVDPKYVAYFHYLLAMYYELNNDYENALIAYQKNQKMNPHPFVEYDIVAIKELIKHRQSNPQLIVLSLTGVGPAKDYHPHSKSVPIYISRSNPYQLESMTLNGEDIGYGVLLTHMTNDLIMRQKEAYRDIVMGNLASDITRQAILTGFDILSMGTASILTRTFSTLKSDGDFRFWDYIYDKVEINRIKLDKKKYVLKIKDSVKNTKTVKFDTNIVSSHVVLMKSYSKNIDISTDN